MPPATHDAPLSSLLCTRTVQPSCAARRATDSPMTPPPMTASDPLVVKSLPSPALPGSGVTVRAGVPTLSPRSRDSRVGHQQYSNMPWLIAEPGKAAPRSAEAAEHGRREAASSDAEAL